jgi:hypothetical protein
MSEPIQSRAISRRKLLFLVGLTASFAAPVTALMVSEAKAQQPAEQAAPSDPAAAAAPKKKVKKKKKAAPSAATPSGTAPAAPPQ